MFNKIKGYVSTAWDKLHEWYDAAMSSEFLKKVKAWMTSTHSSVATKAWLIGDFLMDAVLFVMAWTVLPAFMQLWAVFCLSMAGMVVIREFVTNPIRGKKPDGDGSVRRGRVVPFPGTVIDHE